MDLRETLLRLVELAEGFGLSPGQVNFEVVPAPVMYELGAYGFPGRFSHWSRGKAFHRLYLHHRMGFHRIYELVVASDPVQAFLLDENTPLEHTFVMAHVLAHADFFRKNAHLAGVGQMAAQTGEVHSERVHAYEEAYGPARVEEVLDACLSIEMNAAPGAPGEDSLDVLGFVAATGRLEGWVQDLLLLVREESLYFQSLMRTKIANEGWASYWHLQLLLAFELTDEESWDVARTHAAVLSSPGVSVNPYALGLALFGAIHAQEGPEGLFLARETEDDISLIRNHFTAGLCRSLDLFVFSRRGEGWIIESRDAEIVREALITSLVNGGRPVVTVVGEAGDGTLELCHHGEGRPLDLRHAEKTLSFLSGLWKAPVSLETVMDDRRVVLGHDGRTFSKVLY